MMLQSIFNGIIAGCGYGVIAAGLIITYQVRPFFNLAYGAIYLNSAYVANILIVEHNWRPPIGILVGIVWGVGLGAMMELVIYRPLIKRGASATILLIASLGLLIALQNTVSFAFGGFTRSFFNTGVDQGLFLWDIRVTNVQLTTIGIFVVTSAMLPIWMFYTNSGKIIRAVADNSQLSIAFGINSDRAIFYVSLVSSALAAVAGILAGYDTNIFPTMGFWGILPAVVAIVVGGLGSVSGAFWGAMLVGVTQNLAVWYLPSVWGNATMFIVLFVFLLLKPSGFVGIPVEKSRS